MLEMFSQMICCIDYYNNMIGGVDKAYQMITTIDKQLRCSQTDV
jgi:hypothetical protein